MPVNDPIHTLPDYHNGPICTLACLPMNHSTTVTTTLHCIGYRKNQGPGVPSQLVVEALQQIFQGVGGGEGACTVLPGSPPCELVNPIIKSLSLMHTQKVSGKSISLQPQPTMLSLYSPCTRKCQCQVVIDLSALIDKTGQPIILCKMTPPQPLCTPSPQKLIKRNNAWCINKMTSHPPYKTYNSHTNSSMSS